MRVFIVFLILIVFGTVKSYSKNSIDSLDWVKINPKTSFEDFNWSVLPNGASKEMILSLISSHYVSGNDQITLFPIEGKVYAVLPCRFEVLVWSGKEWENLYKGYAAGQNCKSFFFVKEGKIYSYGKYGFWKANSELIHFDFKSGFWENLPSKNVPTNYAGVVPFVVGNKLVTIFGQYINQSSGIEVSEKNGFYYDFLTGEWFPLEVKIINESIENFWMVPSFDLKDFGIHLYKYRAEIGLLLLDKRDLSFSFKKMDFTPIWTNALSFSKNNKIWFFNNLGNPIHFNLDVDKDSFLPIGKIKLKEQWPTNRNWKNWFIGFLILGLLISIYFNLKSKKKEPELIESEIISAQKQTNNEQSDEEIEKTISYLSEYTNQFFEVDGLDRLLGIEKIENLDYRRVRRNRLIKDVNEFGLEKFGKPIIERKRAESDKRVIIYQILFGK